MIAMKHNVREPSCCLLCEAVVETKVCSKVHLECHQQICIALYRDYGSRFFFLCLDVSCMDSMSHSYASWTVHVQAMLS